MKGSFVLAIDQGTSSTKTVIFDEFGQAIARGLAPLHTIYMDGGRVEQDPFEILNTVLLSVEKCIQDFTRQGGAVSDIKSCGLSNQRETFVLWDETGRPLHHALVWQCKRSTGICARLKSEGFSEMISLKTGLLADPYFSGTKVMWLNENNVEISNAIAAGKAFFGTVDTWLVYKLTNGENYLTDHTNASRTLFFNLDKLSWDQELIEKFGLKGLHLPHVQPSSSHFGATNFNGLLERDLAITAVVGDSHAAAFGEGCFSPGIAKATMGTGSSILMNIGKKPKKSSRGMITTIGWSTETHVEYALEGVIVTCGATIQWLKTNMGLFQDLSQTEEMANAVANSGGVYVIPAFSGLGAPHWEMDRKASITGLTFYTDKNHVVRAALESIPFQIKDVITAMEADSGILLEELMIDGGLTSNAFVVQFLSNLLEKPVVNLGLPEVSALGAAYLSGLKSGVYKSIEHLKQLNKNQVTVSPDHAVEKASIAYLGWQEAIKQGN